MFAVIDQAAWGAAFLVVVVLIGASVGGAALLGLWVSRSALGLVTGAAVAWITPAIVVPVVPGNDGLVLSLLLGPVFGVASAGLLRLGHWRYRRGGLDYNAGAH